MRFDVVTLFSELFAPFLELGITRRAYELGLVDLQFSNPRDFATGRYKRVDDRPFGGGAGMVMMAEPLAACVESIWERRAEKAPVVYFSPTGRTINQRIIESWSERQSGAILICGRYEGVDERFLNHYVDEELSLGDFVLSGGEIAAMAFLDAIARLMPSVLNNVQSHECDSFGLALGGLLDSPQYTRPTVWREQAVPEVLLSGNHAHIERWQRQERLTKTFLNRPDLLDLARKNKCLSKEDERFLQNIKTKTDGEH